MNLLGLAISALIGRFAFVGYSAVASRTSCSPDVNVPHRRLSSMVDSLSLSLMQSGLLYESSAKYRISEKGSSSSGLTTSSRALQKALG
jgi:hypothetical protein